jgi:hypothetical protein
VLSLYAPQAWFGAGQFFAPNPDAGAIVDFFLRDAGDEATVVFADASNRIVRRMRVATHRGLNRVLWDLRMDPPLGDPPADAAPTAFGGLPQGPNVLPGTYTVSIEAPHVKRELKATLKVEADPRIVVSDADRRARMATLMKLYELQRTLGAARGATREAASRGEAPDKDGVRRTDATARLQQLQNDIATQLNAVNTLARAIDAYSGLPTADQQRQVAWAQDDAARIIAALRQITSR